MLRSKEEFEDGVSREGSANTHYDSFLVATTDSILTLSAPCPGVDHARSCSMCLSGLPCVY